MTALVVRRLVEALGIAVAACIGITVLTVLVGLSLVIATLIDTAVL